MCCGSRCRAETVSQRAENAPFQCMTFQGGVAVRNFPLHFATRSLTMPGDQPTVGIHGASHARCHHYDHCPFHPELRGGGAAQQYRQRGDFRSDGVQELMLRRSTQAGYCPGKIQYPSKHDADQASNAIRRRPGGDSGPRGQSYFCPACQSWHIGRLSKRV